MSEDTPVVNMFINIGDESDSASTECSLEILTGRSEHKLADGPIVAPQDKNNNEKKPLAMISQDKNAAASPSKAAARPSRIPRLKALQHSPSSTSLKSLPHSSSSSSLKSFASNTVRLSPIVRQIPRSPSIQVLTQDTTILVRMRKSISQMDIKTARRTGQHYPMTDPKLRYRYAGHGNKGAACLLPQVCDVVTQARQSALSKQFCAGDNYYYFEDQRDSKMIGMKIYSTIMLNAWRKRRDECKRLTEHAGFLKTLITKAKNQVHVCNSLFTVEKKRNEELAIKLQSLTEAVNTSKAACETLTTSLISLNSDKAFLETQIAIKVKEYNDMNTLFSQTNSSLFKVMAQNRELQSALSAEQRTVQWFESQKTDLINEMTNELKVKQMTDDMEIKIKELSDMQDEINRYQGLAATLEEQMVQLKLNAENDAKLKEQLEEIKIEVETLRERLNNTIGSRMKSYLRSAAQYNHFSFVVLHWIAYCLLPALPAPQLTSPPFGRLSMEKALSFVKR